MKEIVNLADFERRAQRVLPRTIFEFIAGVAEDGVTASANLAAFASLRLIPHMEQKSAERSSAFHLWGETWSAPFGIAPMGAAAAFAMDADVKLARAAAAENVPFVLSGASVTPLETVIQANPRAWFQMYASTAEKSRALVHRAQRAGFKTLVVTVDVPVGGKRECDIRNGYSSPLRPSFRLACSLMSRPSWLVKNALASYIRHGLPHFENLAGERLPMIAFRPQQDLQRIHQTWESLKALRDAWPGRFVIKGLLHTADIHRAAAIGADAVVVSNHGGRQLDCTISPIEALPEINRSELTAGLFCDGGIRRGNDVIKALGVGAHLAFVGRPMMYAVISGGQDGVVHAIRLLREEILRSMAMLGMSALDEASTHVAFQPAMRHF
ncbi:alpha-hydroxy acid oxidase [Ottowia thiooxydans]|uniref:alpha-hydroxy acid oxidase n=1 Tax=Ottowia thiooxydans TaxID=219182 RepID=UPI000401E547|nr:alpha-hydroxy acid oxidase [Ottowia thiooxydans]